MTVNMQRGRVARLDTGRDGDGDIRWRPLIALLVGLVAGWAFEYGGAALSQGPISRVADGADFSWLASIVFGGLAYSWLSRSDPHLVGAPSLDSGDRGEVVAPEIVRRGNA